MKTKKLSFDSKTLEVIRSMEWSDDGTKGVIKAQLDRATYEAVNKALVAMGGKWNRTAKAHVFEKDPRSNVEGLLEVGAVVVEKDGFFETPNDVITKMFAIRPPRLEDLVLEPSAGKGAILRRVVDNFAKKTPAITAVEWNGDRVDYIKKNFPKVKTVIKGDFMAANLEPGFTVVYMNPPFENGADALHVMRAYDLLANGGTLVSVMGEGVFFRKDKASKAFREWLDEAGGESEKLPAGAFKESGTGVNTRLVWVTKKEFQSIRDIVDKQESWPAELNLGELLDEMTQRFADYVSSGLMSRNADKIDRRVREDFAAQGGKARGIRCVDGKYIQMPAR